MNKSSLTFCAVLLLGLCSLAEAAPAPAVAGGKDPAELLREGLFEEEANRDPGKAAAAYAGVIELYDAQRTFAATAMFRLAEVRAAQDNKAEATSLYQRLLTEFPNQDPLAKLSRERLAALGAPAPVPAGSPPNAPADEEGKMLAQYEAQPHLHDYDSVVDEGSVQRHHPDDLYRREGLDAAIGFHARSWRSRRWVRLRRRTLARSRSQWPEGRGRPCS